MDVKNIDPSSVMTDIRIGDTLRCYEGPNIVVQSEEELAAIKAHFGLNRFGELKQTPAVERVRNKRKIRVKPELEPKTVVLDPPVPPGGILR